MKLEQSVWLIELVRWEAYGTAALLALLLLLWPWMVLVPPIVVEVPRLYLGARGLALPGLILLTPGMGEGALRHELAHQRQMRRYSPLGAVVLLGYHYLRLALAFRRQHGHWADFWTLHRLHPLEREAYAAMEEAGPVPRHLDLRRRAKP